MRDAQFEGKLIGELNPHGVQGVDLGCTGAEQLSARYGVSGQRSHHGIDANHGKRQVTIGSGRQLEGSLGARPSSWKITDDGTCERRISQDLRGLRWMESGCCPSSLYESIAAVDHAARVGLETIV